MSILFELFDGPTELVHYIEDYLSIDDRIILRLTPRKLKPTQIELPQLEVKVFKRPFYLVWEWYLPKFHFTLRKDCIDQNPRYQTIVFTRHNECFYTTEWETIHCSINWKRFLLRNL